MTTPIPKLPRDFGFGEDHEVLRDSAQRFLAERCPMDEVRRLADDPLGYDPGLWKEIAGLGWTGLMVAEEHGGAGLGALHFALLLEEMGRVLLPSPFLAGALAGAALDAAGDARWLPGLASGDLLATLAFAEPDGSWEPGDVAATAEPGEGGFVLRGVKAYVPAAPSANLVVAPFREPNGAIALFAVELPAAGVVVEPETGVDPTRRSGRVVFEGARVGAESRLPGDGAAALAAAFRLGWTALAAEAVGAAEATLILTRDYAVDRAQFGRQIGSFQAVKHPIVNVMIAVESARTLAYGAAAAIDHAEDGSEVPARMAKAAAGDAFHFAANRAVQLHGGYGFTIDCDVHHFFKRALWVRATLGDAIHHRRHLAGALIDPS
jgi:alkylation response protein AidB-like acyl-CoA dehydrogenase